MRIFNLTLCAVVLSCIAAGSAFSQDPLFMNFTGGQHQLNPALTGAAGQHRIDLNYRARLVSIPGMLRTFSAAYDGNYLPQKGQEARFFHNFGGEMLSMSFMEGISRLNQVQIKYALAWRPGSGTHTFRLGLAAGYVDAGMEIVRLIQEGIVQHTVYPWPGFHPPDYPVMRRENVSFGFSWQTKRSWAGIAVDRLTQPGIENGVEKNYLPRKVSFEAGTRIPVSEDGRFFVSPNLTVIQQGLHLLSRPGMQLGLGSFDAGLGYLLRYQQSEIATKPDHDFILTLGYRFRNVVGIRYAYDYQVSTLSNGISGGSHEFGLYVLLGQQTPGTQSPWTRTAKARRNPPVPAGD